MKLRLVLFILIANSLYSEYERTTSEVAAAVHYQAFLDDYRNKSERLLNLILIEMKLRVQELASKNLFHRAEALQTSYEGDFIRMQDTINDYFSNFDEEFLIGARKLDAEEGSEKEKAAFIGTLKEKISRALDTLITFYQAKFNIPQQPIDSSIADLNYKKLGKYQREFKNL